MKKYISIILCVVLLSTTCAFAGTVEKYVDEAVDVFTFSPESKLYALDKDVNIEKVTYEYEMQEIEDLKAFVKMNFSLHLGDTVCPVFVSGLVDGYILDDGNILWEGPLDGNTVFNGEEYNIIAGFSKIKATPDVRVGVTMSRKSETNKLTAGQFDNMVFAFGEEVISKDVINKIGAKANILGDASLELNALNEVGAFALEDISLAGFDTSLAIPGYGQRARLYFADDSMRVAVGSKSYCSNVNSYFASMGGAITTIATHSINLQRGTDENSTLTSIDGIETFDFNVTNYGIDRTALAPLFEDILALLGVPSSTIMAVLDSLTGNVRHFDYSNSESVVFNFGLFDNANYDDSAVGLPIVFQLDVSPTSNGECTYIYTTEYRYKTVVATSGGESGTVYYTDADTITKSVDLQILMG